MMHCLHYFLWGVIWFLLLPTVSKGGEYVQGMAGERYIQISSSDVVSHTDRNPKTFWHRHKETRFRQGMQLLSRGWRYLCRIGRKWYNDLLKTLIDSYLPDVLREQWLEFESRRLAVRIRDTQERRKRAQLMEELRQVLEDLFTLKQRRRKKEVERLRQQVREAEARIKQREAHRKEIIEQRMQQLLGEAPLWRW